MKYDVIVVGGGIVGLASALRVLQALPHAKLLLLEKEQSLGAHQTGHNSGVIHSGLYYKPGSLKARNCKEGYQQLLSFCEAEQVPFEICGKIVVATSEEELPWLDELYRRGVGNGLAGIRYLAPEEIRDFEPHCAGVRALHVPQTGIVDYLSLANKYAEKLRDMGAEIVLGQRVERILQKDSLVEVLIADRTYVSKALITCAGLQSDRLALQTDPNLPLRIIPFRGEYYKLKPEAYKLVRNLIYPVPNPAFPFLGVHFTRMINGGVECGPNAVFAFGREAYKKSDFNLGETIGALSWPGFRQVAYKYWRAGMGEFYRSLSKQAFVRALQKLVPEIQGADIVPGGAGIRAQACDDQGRLLDDFSIRTDKNIVHVCNAPSPAATSSLAIGGSISRFVLPLIS